jgi:hypothetical protein
VSSLLPPARPRSHVRLLRAFPTPVVFALALSATPTPQNSPAFRNSPSPAPAFSDPCAPLRPCLPHASLSARGGVRLPIEQRKQLLARRRSAKGPAIRKDFVDVVLKRGTAVQVVAGGIPTLPRAPLLTSLLTRALVN